MATNRKDIALDENDDLKIVDGDFVIEPSDQQHIRAIFYTHMGEFKQWPILGFGASNYLKKSKVFKPELLRNLNEQLKYDNYTNAEINLSKGIEKLIIKV